MPKRKTRAWTKAQKGKKVITNVESDPQAQEPLMSATGNGKESKTVPVNTKKVQDSKDETVGNRYPRAADEWRTEKSTSMPTKKDQKEPVQTDAQAPLASPVLGSGEDPKSPADTLTYNADTSVPMEEAKKDVQTQTDAQEPSTDGVEAMKVPAPGPVKGDQEHNQTQTDAPKPASGVEAKNRSVTTEEDQKNPQDTKEPLTNVDADAVMDKDTPASLEKDQKNEQKPQESAAPEYKKDERILYRLMPALTFASLEKTWMATQETEEAPNDKLDYEVGELVCTCLPAKLISVTRATNLDGWTECLLTGLVKRTILETPSFPQSLSQPKKSLHYIADAPAAGEATSKPLTGLHASTSIEMGDLVFSERPVLIVPASIRIGEIFVEHLSHEEQNRLVMKHWLETLETVFHRVSKKDQEAFWKLRDIWQKDGKKSIHGIVQTNGFKVTGLEDPGLEGNLGMYSGVCIQMSQINHSCRPNLERYWDMASFSMQLRATRKISRGEELTLSFIDQLQPFAVRKEKLKQFDIVCSCPSCKKPKIGDMRRKQFIAGSPSTQEFTDWIKDPTRGDDHIIKRALVQISLLEADGLENSPYYDDCLSTIMLVYITLGDKEKAMRWGKQLGKWKQCRLGPESAREYDNPQKYTKHALWKLRVKIVNDMRATSYSLGKH